MSNPGYAVIAVYKPGNSDPSILSASGKILIFDTPTVAKQFIGQLGNGRIAHYSVDEETVTWSPILRNEPNKAVVLTGYDPYDTPPGAIRSEVRLMPWKRHAIWTDALVNRGQIVTCSDGTMANIALGDEVY